MALIAVAETAQDVASGFNKFLDQVPEYSSEITGLISECFAISSGLRELNTGKDDPRYYRAYNDVRPKVQIVQQSLEYTFRDVLRLFAGLGRPTHISTRIAYNQVWREIDDHFWQEGRTSLVKRLENDRLFLQQLTCILMDGRPSNVATYYDLQEEIEDLLQKQELRLEAAFNNMSLGDPGIARQQRSFERSRPPGLFTQTQAHDPPPVMRGGLGRRAGPQSPQSPPGADYEYPWAPAAPEVPNSPTTTTTFSTQSSSASSSLNHWLPIVFGQSRPNTIFHNAGPVSACYGPDMPGASSRLAREYDKLLDVPFEDGDLRVRLYHRSSDQRARIHCRVIRNGRPKKQCCLPLTALQIQRHQSCLKLCRMSSSGQALELWACLRFPSYERLVLFYCSFIALRAEDAGNPVTHVDDYEIHREKIFFSGVIIDDNYEHALRVFQDRDSGGIRLQASVCRGELKRTPVWTAFITTHVASHRWMRKAGSSSKVVYLVDLQRYVFTDEYNHQLGPEGQHELRFTTSRDAAEFMEAIDELADAQLGVQD